MINELEILERLENTIEVGLKEKVYDELLDVYRKLDKDYILNDIEILRLALIELEGLRKLK